jgi:hypothetical protein
MRLTAMLLRRSSIALSRHEIIISLLIICQAYWRPSL